MHETHHPVTKIQKRGGLRYEKYHTIGLESLMEEGNDTWHNSMREIHGPQFGFILQTSFIHDVTHHQPVRRAVDPLVLEILTQFHGPPPENMEKFPN